MLLKAVMGTGAHGLRVTTGRGFYAYPLRLRLRPGAETRPTDSPAHRKAGSLALCRLYFLVARQPVKAICAGFDDFEG